MNIIQDFITSTNTNRPGTSLTVGYVTIHETANTNVGANAEMHARYVKGDDAQNRQVSWHYTVDDSETYQHLPTDEVGWHAGSTGNHQSIGIEICVNQDGNFIAARANAIKLVQLLMQQHDISLSHVVTHQHWTGKNCPANLLADWEGFIADVGSSTNESIGTVRVLATALWVYNRADWDARYETVSRDEVFTVVRELTVNGSRMYQLRSGLYITANPEFVQFQS
ncbi:N-acetylmuramoyl-L-alanine amidase [Alkalicoccobacillus porphyridii]|uniref:N-acetylmuramoyl-L-alanine amidase n=1 Tax=Alkalicoccobacillus porphyridii TaxID=2597270 RepID=A0A554A2G5_9BACI|nr:N-acetylmuramoyl-L-alanine amidase [Alkalicoccobacillus porphyridii]TSB47882.1 N-acetylmuramoyl-L-alanine amidase [Alkalicoccobacillus porphyridii]